MLKAAILVTLTCGATLVNAQQPEWSVTGSLTTARFGHTATLLANGKVLVVGGTEFLEPSVDPYWRGISSVEIYDPVTSHWSDTGSLNSPRTGHIAVRLMNGKVLVAGGNNGYRKYVITAEIYDPETGTWSAAGSFSAARSNASATLLLDGRVLVAGGASSAWASDTSRTAEVYDPDTGAWSPAGTMNTARSSHTATLLLGGRVLVVGGTSSNSRSAELYDPVTRRWAVTGNLITGRLWDHEAALLPNGKVLVFGGGINGDDFCNGINNSELYDPITGQWSATDNSISTRNDYYDTSNTTVLPSGKLLVVGGDGPGCEALKSAELYDPSTGNWSTTGGLNTARAGHTVTMLANGKVLVAGGDGGTTAELFDDGTPTAASVSAASFAAGGMLAPESIAAARGANLGTGTLTASSYPLPTELAGATVKVRDRAGAERLAPLIFVSPTQINYQVPAGTAIGLATVTISNGSRTLATGLVEIARVAPGLFSANSSGQGVAAGFSIRASAAAARSQDYLFDFTTFKPVPVDLGPPSDQVFLSLYGTGFRGATSVTAKVGGVSVQVYGFAPVTDYPGLDVVNIGPLPRVLQGRGEVDVTLSLDGKAANTVSVALR